MRVGQVDPEGLISLTERGALPRPATIRMITCCQQEKDTLRRFFEGRVGVKQWGARIPGKK